MRDISDITQSSKKDLNDNANNNQNAVNLHIANKNFNEKTVNKKKIKSKQECHLDTSKYKDFLTSNCTINKCPNGFTKSSDDKQCEMDMKDINVYRYKKKHNCGTQYIDWITIPNFHLDNTYFKLNTGKKKDDFNGCFEPCNFDFIPYKDIKEKNAEISKDSIYCIRKSISNVGKYGQITLDYCPLTLIILLSFDIEDNDMFKNEYVTINATKNIEPEIKTQIKDNTYLLKEMKQEIMSQGKNYIIHLYNKYKPDFLDKLKLNNDELNKCHITSISNISENNCQTILHAYSVYKTIDENVDKYVRSYMYSQNDNGDILELKKLHKRMLTWACKYSFDEKTSYGKKNLELYNKYNKKDDIESQSNQSEIDYIRKVNKNEIKNENDIFFFFTYFSNPGLLLKKLINSESSDYNSNILKNNYIVGMPVTIFFMILVVILLIVCVLFYKYTKPIYAKVRELTIILVYGIASVFDKSIKPKYIISDLLEYVRERVKNPRKIEALT